jgi:hypothetical protein
MKAEWQRGFDLNLLRSYAGLFRRAHGRFIFGAFGLEKERDIAAALAAGHMIFDKRSSPPKAAAIFSILRSASTHADFAQRAIKLSAGALFVKSFALIDRAAGGRLMAALLGRAEAAGIREAWIEIFEEDRAAKRIVTAAGFRYVATKIAAASELKALYVRGLVAELAPLDELDRPNVLAPMGEELTGDELAAIEIELDRYLRKAGGGWQQHYSNYNQRSSWTAFALRGFQTDPGFIIKPAEMSRRWKEQNAALLLAACGNTAAAKSFPVTLGIIGEHLPQRKERVRFMRLAPGGELTRHADITDRAAGLGRGNVARLHFPIMTNARCLFHTIGLRGEAARTHFRRGGLYYLDTRKPHAVQNAGASERVHLVVDTLVDDALRARLRAIS